MGEKGLFNLFLVEGWSATDIDDGLEGFPDLQHPSVGKVDPA